MTSSSALVRGFAANLRNRSLRVPSSPTRWRSIFSLVTVVGVAVPAAVQADPLKPGRVLIFDLQADEGAEPHVAQAREAMEQLIAGHAGFEPIADAVLRRALSSRKATDPECALADACRRDVGRALHADLVLSGSLTKQGSRFVLDVAVAVVEGGVAPQSTSESMKRIASLSMNIKLCLDRLFQWPEPAPEQPAASPPVPPAAPLTAPPIAPVAPAPAPVEPVVAVSKPPDKRPVLALLTVRAGAAFTDAELSSVEEGLLSTLDEAGRFRVVGRTDIATMLDLEAKKQLVGCEENDGCMTAIAGSLGADYVASANVGRLGNAIQLTFKVIDVRRAVVLVHARQMVATDSQLVTAANEISDEVVRAVFGPGAALPVHKRIEAAPEGLTPTAKRNIHGLGIATTIAGGLALVAASALAIIAHNDTTAARAKATASLQTEVNTINTMAVSSDALFGAGGAIAAVGTGLTVAF